MHKGVFAASRGVPAGQDIRIYWGIMRVLCIALASLRGAFGLLRRGAPGCWVGGSLIFLSSWFAAADYRLPCYCGIHPVCIETIPDVTDKGWAVQLAAGDLIQGEFEFGGVANVGEGEFWVQHVVASFG